MILLKNRQRLLNMNKKIIILIILIIAILAALVGQRFYAVQKAHSTFENYYLFRSCVELLEKTDDYALCRIQSGETIKIVKVNNKWYLDGDLPVCHFGWCF